MSRNGSKWLKPAIGNGRRTGKPPPSIVLKAWTTRATRRVCEAVEVFMAHSLPCQTREIAGPGGMRVMPQAALSIVPGPAGAGVDCRQELGAHDHGIHGTGCRRQHHPIRRRQTLPVAGIV